MTHSESNGIFRLRPLYPRDFERLAEWGDSTLVIANPLEGVAGSDRLTSQWTEWSKRVSRFALPNQPRWSGFVAESEADACGLIEVSPFNRTRSTWRVDRLVVNPDAVPPNGEGPLDRVGSQLLRHCFEQVWEARMWLSEVGIQHTSALALYRQNGFQPLAQVTYWEISAAILAEQAEREPDLPNLMAVSNADAQLLYQLDTAAMPPLVRQVFDQQIQDFKIEPIKGVADTAREWMQRVDTIRGYVFEPQRKAAIGRFKLTACRSGRQMHMAQLTVHPAYTWLYPEMVSHMARLLQPYPASPLRLTSCDYQPEREGYLLQIQANPIDRTLMMSRSVWHKVRESKPMTLEGLQLPEVLPGLQPVGKPMPGRMSWQKETLPSRQSPSDRRLPNPPHSTLESNGTPDPCSRESW